LMSLYQLLEGLAAAPLGSSNQRFDVVRFDHLRLHRVTFFARSWWPSLVPDPRRRPLL
jgi:hypothetical protein